MAPTAVRISAMRVLLVEDDPSIGQAVAESLASEGFIVTRVTSGRAALEADEHDLMLLDLGLPDIDGREVCRQIRARSTMPIIMLTARSEEFDRVLGLEMGADDYITKPFSLRELGARIRAVLRRTTDATARPDDGPQQIATMSIDRRTRRLSVDDTEIYLTAKEFDVLAYLANDVGAVHTRVDILENVWDAHWYGPTKTVDAHVASLRKKLGEREWITAVRGVGFRFEPPP
jgi:two-component system, OmpR family, response regulator RegX3